MPRVFWNRNLTPKERQKRLVERQLKAIEARKARLTPEILEARRLRACEVARQWKIDNGKLKGGSVRGVPFQPKESYVTQSS